MYTCHLSSFIGFCLWVFKFVEKFTKNQRLLTYCLDSSYLKKVSSTFCGLFTISTFYQCSFTRSCCSILETYYCIQHLCLMFFVIRLCYQRRALKRDHKYAGKHFFFRRINTPHILSTNFITNFIPFNILSSIYWLAIVKYNVAIPNSN